MGMHARNEMGVSLTPTKNEKGSSKRPCRKALVAPPSALPNTMEVREIGVTSISFKKPNSRSHMREIPSQIAVKRRV